MLTRHELKFAAISLLPFLFFAAFLLGVASARC
jgi:hypothetical protein